MIRLKFPLEEYTYDVLSRVAHRLSDRMSVEVSTVDDEWNICISAYEGEAEDVKKFVLSEIYDQTLRSRISKETDKIKDLIFAAAFSNLQLK